MSVTAPRRTFTVDEFAQMGQAGIFAEDERIELIEGEIRRMSPIGPTHAAVVKRLIALLGRQAEGRAIVGAQDPIQLDDFTQPQPDLTLLRVREDFYADAHPHPHDVLLVIEVADTSLAYDRDEKLPRYAQAGIPEVWLVDLGARTVFQFTHPAGSSYESEKEHTPGETIVSFALADLRLAVRDVLG